MTTNKPLKSITLNRLPLSQQKLALESSIKLLINGCLSVAAVTALAKIVPYHISQEHQLQEVRNEVKVTEARVDQLREDFSRSFSSAEGTTKMEEYSPKVHPNQRRVFWLEEKKGQNN